MDQSGRRIRRVLQGMWAATPYYASLALRLPLVADANTQTVSTDGTVLRYSPKWVTETPADQIRQAMAGCVVGCVLKHHLRRGERDYGRWQAAHAAVVKPILRADGLSDDEGGLDMSIEAAYDIMPESPPEGDDKSQPGDGGGCGEMQDSPRDESQSEAEQAAAQKAAEQEWDRASHIAGQHAKSEGRDAGKAAEMIAAAHSGKIDYVTLLRRFMHSHARADTSWSRPNRRYISQGIYLPALHSQAMGGIVLAIDTSCSLDDQELAMIWSEIRNAAQQIEPEMVHVVQCDSKVQSVETYDWIDLPVDIEVKGRGGTRFSPVFEAVEDLPKPACLIYYTDLESRSHGDEPDYPVLWLATPSADRDNVPPWGEVVWLGGER